MIVTPHFKVGYDMIESFTKMPSKPDVSFLENEFRAIDTQEGYSALQGIHDTEKEKI
jgi:hypothetical protein